MTNTTSNMNLPVAFTARNSPDGLGQHENRYGAIATVFGHKIAEVGADYPGAADAIRACYEEILDLNK